LVSVIDIIAKPLENIINTCFEGGIFPKELKIAKTIPIYKAKENNKLGNYRPISLLCSLSKIFEKLIHVRLYSFFVHHNLIYTQQYGFLPKHSTQDAVHHLHNTIVNSIENQEFTVGIFLDLSKAFDTINHQILINKLSNYGVRGNTLQLLETYIKDRHQFVSYNNTESQLKPLTVGVP
jgi:retron-type reverse transcriptase